MKHLLLVKLSIEWVTLQLSQTKIRNYWKQFVWFLYMQSSFRVMKTTEKFGHFPAWKSREKNFFGLLVWKKKIIIQTWSFDIHFHNISFKTDNFAFIVLTIIVPVFNLAMDMSFRKVQAWKMAGKSLEICIRNCAWTLYMFNAFPMTH